MVVGGHSCHWQQIVRPLQQFPHLQCPWQELCGDDDVCVKLMMILNQAIGRMGS